MEKECIEELLNEWGNKQYKNIEKEKTKNRDQCHAFTDMGEFGEELSLEMFPEYTGSASKGGCAFDLKKEDITKEKILDAKEVKCMSLNGSKECKSCKRKCPPFQERCLKCNSNEFNNKCDSRAGISASAHIKYKEIISEYIIIPVRFDNDKITIECYSIRSDNNYFNDYIVNQHENGSGDTCNCLPGSIDFHLSGPIKYFEYHIYTDKLECIFYDLKNDKYLDIPSKNYITGATLKFKYNDENDKLFDNKEDISYIENIDKFKLKSKKNNNHGKSRGETSRN